MVSFLTRRTVSSPALQSTDPGKRIEKFMDDKPAVKDYSRYKLMGKPLNGLTLLAR
jgi:hypothetical protein